MARTQATRQSKRESRGVVPSLPYTQFFIIRIPSFSVFDFNFNVLVSGFLILYKLFHFFFRWAEWVLSFRVLLFFKNRRHRTIR